MKSHLPLYAQVEAVLTSSIADGTLPPGSRVPSEDSLIERFAVSRTTIRKTIQNLASSGLIEIRRGKGTFVTQPKITQELTELSGFVEDMRALGRKPTARLSIRRSFRLAKPSRGSLRSRRVLLWSGFNGFV
jgi:GntR family transcriptional regulator